jgi:hypothetical protein
MTELLLNNIFDDNTIFFLLQHQASYELDYEKCIYCTSIYHKYAAYIFVFEYKIFVFEYKIFVFDSLVECKDILVYENLFIIAM